MKNKIVAGLLAIFLGSLGIHWFYLGRNGRGLTYLLITILLCWTIVAPCIISIIAFIEGIIFLMKSDQEFDNEYNVTTTTTQTA